MKQQVVVAEVPFNTELVTWIEDTSNLRKKQPSIKDDSSSLKKEYSQKLQSDMKDTNLRELAAGRNMRALLEQKYSEWRDYTDKIPPTARSNILPEELFKYNNKVFHNLVKLGPHAVPYLLEKIENKDYFVYLYILYHINQSK